MADLTGKTPAATFESLLNVGTADSQELDSTLRVIEDGKGNDSSMKLTITGSTYGASFVGRVGIGTDTPGDDLEIKSGTPTIRLTDSDYPNAYSEIANASGSLTFKTDVGADIGTETMQFWTGGAQRVTLKADGKVGIGTDSPDAILDVSAHAATAVIASYDSDSITTNPSLKLRKSNNNTVGTITETADNTELGVVTFDGVNSSSAFASGAYILGRQMSSAGSSYVGGEIAFYTGTDSAAPTQKMTVLDSGNVGIGTAAPSAELEVADAGSDAVIAISGFSATDTHVPTLVLRKSSGASVGTITKTDDGEDLGIIRFYGTTDDSTDAYALAANILCEQDASATTTMTGRLIFQTYNAGSLVNSMTIRGDGDVGIQDTTPSKMLDVKNGTSGGDILCYDLYTHDGGVTTSDERKKTNIADSSLGLSFINALKPRSYKWKDTPESTDSDGNFFEAVSYERTHYGLIAQEVKQVIDDLSLTEKDFAGWCYEEDRDLYALRYTEFISPLIKAIQELSAKVTALENA